MLRLVAACCAAALLSGAPPTFAEEQRDPGGSLNPEEMTVNAMIARAARGESSMVVCMQAYFAIKSADHEGGKTILDACSDEFTAAMHWQSYMEHNGLGRPEDPAKAADWDRLAAERGDPIGQFNYGLDLLRGHGVAPDAVRGRQWIDRAAETGLEDAIRLRGAGYDPAVVTPDADDWRYEADGKHF